MGFTGDASTGTPGDISETYRNQTVLRMNIFRRMAGLQPVTANPEYNRLCQAAAVLMSANGKISHNPDPTWKFFTQDGLRGAENSSLAIGYNGPSAIYAYMLDYGQGNEGVGHRNVLLEPALRYVGTGDAPEMLGNLAANSSGVGFDPDVFVRDPGYALPYFAWPPSGYVPHSIIPGRWSIRVSDVISPKVTFRDARVTVWRNGKRTISTTPGTTNGRSAVWTLDGTSEGASYTWYSLDGEQIYASTDRGDDTYFYVVIENVRYTETGALYNGTGIIRYDVVAYDPIIATLVPKIILEPTSQNVYEGMSATLISGANGATGYQWLKGDTPIQDATGEKLVLINITSADAGTYWCKIEGKAGMIATRRAILTVLPASTPSAARIVNISTRSFVGSGDEVQIAGFVIGGMDRKEILLRAAGPSLTQFNVPNVLSDPVLELYDKDGNLIEKNDDWDAAAKAATSMIPWWFASQSKDSAMLISLHPGAYTAKVSGKNGSTGIALVEAYEIGATRSTLVNISTRSFTKTGPETQIAGFIIGGETPKRVLVRAAGQGLTQFRISGVLADTVLELFDESGQKISENDNWELSSKEATPTVYWWFLEGSKDSALVALLAPGAYTAKVTGKGGASGVALVEVYELP